jgi:hypothetical protein
MEHELRPRRVCPIDQWMKPNLRIKAFYGDGENAAKTEIWTAVSVYVLVAMVRKRLPDTVNPKML